VSGFYSLWRLPSFLARPVRTSVRRSVFTLDTEIGDYGQMAFSPDGKLLATAFQGGKIQIWNTQDGSLIQTLVVYDTHFIEEPAVVFTFSPDGRILATGMMGIVQFWGVMP
jgi:WD40 repeat protein